MQQFKSLGTSRCVEEGHIVKEKNWYPSREGSIVQVGAGVGWMSHTAAEEMSLKKRPCIMTASGSKAPGHRHWKEGGYHFTIPTCLGRKALRRSYFPQLGVVIGNNSICL